VAPDSRSVVSPVPIQTRGTVALAAERLHIGFRAVSLKKICLVSFGKPYGRLLPKAKGNREQVLRAGTEGKRNRKGGRVKNSLFFCVVPFSLFPAAQTNRPPVEKLCRNQSQGHDRELPTRGNMTTQKKEPFRISTEDVLTLIDTAPESVDWLVEGIIPSEGLTIIGSKPKSGKTTLVTQLMADVAEGRPFLGHCTKSVDILYLYLEGPKSYPGMRFKKLGYTGTRSKIEVFKKTMPWDGYAGLDALVHYLEQNRNIKLVAIDTLPKLVRLADSDKYDGAVLAMERLEKVAQYFHVQVLCVTHSKKRAGDEAGDSLMGSTAFRGSSDTNIFLTRHGDQRIIQTEQRLGDALEPHQLNLDSTTGLLSLGKPMSDVEDGIREARKRETRRRIENEITDALLMSGTLSQTDLRNRVKGKAETVLSVLKEMEGSKLEVVEKDGAKLYCLAVIKTEKRSA
jgi:AAA domain